MRVQAKTSIAVNHGAMTQVYGYGQEFDLPDHEAEPLLAAGHVVRVETPDQTGPGEPAPAIEKATLRPTNVERAEREAATRRRQGGRP